MGNKVIHELGEVMTAWERSSQGQRGLKQLANSYILKRQYKEVVAITERMLLMEPQNYEALYLAAAAYSYLLKLRR